MKGTDRKRSVDGISATRGSAILGLNKYKTPLLAWQEIMELREPGFNEAQGFTLPEDEETAPMRWGTGFEGPILEYLGRSIDFQPDGFQRLIEADKEPKRFGYIDAADTEPRLHEVKTTFERSWRNDWGEPGSDRVPRQVQVQVQHCMDVAGMDTCIVSVLVFPKPVVDWEAMGWEFQESGMLRNSETDEILEPAKWVETLAGMGYLHQYEVQANPKSQAALRRAYRRFWQKYVVAKAMPVSQDYDDVRRIFKAPRGVLVLSGTEEAMMREYKNLGAEVGEGGFLKKRQAQLKTKILHICSSLDTVADEEAVEKIVFRDPTGKKLGQWNGTTFRVN